MADSKSQLSIHHPRLEQDAHHNGQDNDGEDSIWSVSVRYEVGLYCCGLQGWKIHTVYCAIFCRVLNIHWWQSISCSCTNAPYGAQTTQPAAHNMCSDDAHPAPHSTHRALSPVPLPKKISNACFLWIIDLGGTKLLLQYCRLVESTRRLGAGRSPASLHQKP